MSPDAVVRGADGKPYGVEYKTASPFYSWARTTILRSAVDPERTLMDWPRCDGCSTRTNRAETLGCDCEARTHVLCPKCVTWLTGAGTVLVLGAELPVVLEVCPDGLRLARELMEDA